MVSTTHPKICESKKKGIVVEGKEHIVRVVDGESISPKKEHKLAVEIEKEYERAMKKYGVKP